MKDGSWSWSDKGGVRAEVRCEGRYMLVSCTYGDRTNVVCVPIVAAPFLLDTLRDWLAGSVVLVNHTARQGGV